MSLQKAIEILDYISLREEVLNRQRKSNSISITDLSFNCQLWELSKMWSFILEGKDDRSWQPSPDTEYKVNLTAWIERKQKERNTFDSSQEQIREYFKKVLNKKPSPEIEQAMKELKRERIDPLIVRDNGLSRWNVTCLDHEEGQG